MDPIIPQFLSRVRRRLGGKSTRGFLGTAQTPAPYRPEFGLTGLIQARAIWAIHAPVTNFGLQFGDTLHFASSLIRIFSIVFKELGELHGGPA